MIVCVHKFERKEHMLFEEGGGANGDQGIEILIHEGIKTCLSLSSPLEV